MSDLDLSQATKDARRDLGCTKKSVLVECEARLKPPSFDMYEIKSREDYARKMEEWAIGIQETFGNKIVIDRRFQTQCSACGREFEDDPQPDGSIHCAWCGAKLKGGAK